MNGTSCEVSVSESLPIEPAAARAFWSRSAPRYDLSMWVLGWPLGPAGRLAAEEVRGAGRVLELAAGTGLVTRVLAPAVGELEATDYAPGMVARLEDRLASLPNVTVRQRDVYALDGPPRYDAVVAANLLHLLPDLDGALERMIAVLRPGGRLVVPTYCHDETGLARLVSAGMGRLGFPGQRAFSLDALAGAVEAHGLRVRQRRVFAGVLPIGFVSADVPG